MTVHKLAVLLLTGLLQVEATDKVLYEGSMQELSFRAVLLDPNRFSEGGLEKIGREFLRDSQRSKLAKLSLFTREGDAATTLFGKGILSQVGYRSWIIGFRQYSLRIDPMADVFVIHGAAVLRYHDAAGRVGRIVLAGDDPLKLRAGEAQFEIIDIVFPRLPPLSTSGGSDVEVFLRTVEPLREEYGFELTRCLSEMFAVRDIRVHVRNDNWFIGDTWFPYFFRFQTDLRPPTHDEYYRSEELYCMKNDTGFVCGKHNPVDEAGKHPLLKKK